MDDIIGCQYSARLAEKLNLLSDKYYYDFRSINKAIYWAKKYYDDRLKTNGESFYSHAMEVACIISDFQPNTDVLVASIMHSIQGYSTVVTNKMLQDDFGIRIAQMVDRLTRVRPDGTKLSVEDILNNAYEVNDQEVLLIKLCSRLRNMQTIKLKSQEKQVKIAKETLEQFIFFAMYLDNIDLERQIVRQASSILFPDKKDSYLHSIFEERSKLCLHLSDPS